VCDVLKLQWNLDASSFKGWQDARVVATELVKRACLYDDTARKEKELHMFKRILVPLDGSPRAEQALSIAAQFARQSDGTVILLRVISLATEYWPAILSPYGIPEAVIEDEQAIVEKYLHTVATSPVLSDVKTECDACFGAIAPTILAEAHKAKANLIIMFSRGYMGMTRHVMRSEADKVAHHATIPTLIFHDHIVPEGETLSAGHIAQPLRMLVPLDGSSYAENALRTAISFLSVYSVMGRKVALHLLRVTPHLGATNGLGQEKILRKQQVELIESRHYLQEVVERLRTEEIGLERVRLGAAVTWSVLQRQDIAETIVRVAEGNEDTEGVGVFGGCDFVVISTHGDGARQRWTMGSVAERVLDLSRHPVLVSRPPATLDLLPAAQQNLAPHIHYRGK
jgi:nucleotide-binding universal stress UspA family protein